MFLTRGHLSQNWGGGEREREREGERERDRERERERKREREKERERERERHRERESETEGGRMQCFIERKRGGRTRPRTLHLCVRACELYGV